MCAPIFPFMNFSLLKRLTIILAAAFVVIVFPSCATGPAEPPKKATHVLYEWHDDGGPEPVSVKINLTSQKAIVKRGDRQIAWCYVSTGKEGRGTPPGKYYVMEKIADKYSNKYGWVQNDAGEVTNSDAHPGVRVGPGEKYYPAPMPYWQRITGYGIGMHVGNIPTPGQPASHGCIRMPKEFAPLLYEVTKVGTPVTIEYGKSDAPVPAPVNVTVM